MRGAEARCRGQHWPNLMSGPADLDGPASKASARSSSLSYSVATVSQYKGSMAWPAPLPPFWILPFWMGGSLFAVLAGAISRLLLFPFLVAGWNPCHPGLIACVAQSHGGAAICLAICLEKPASCGSRRLPAVCFAMRYACMQC